MFATLAHLFTVAVYQPFLNVLVFFYWLLEVITQGHADMGIAVILLTVLIRLLLLPLSLAGHKSEAERREIAAQVREVEETYADDPIRRKEAKKSVLRGSRRVLVSELFNLAIQVMIALMLWRIFNTGLTGEDLHLIYPFMPDVEQPFNLLFLGEYDLTHTSFRLNLLQSFLIFLVETISIYTSVYPVTRSEVVRLQLVLPLVSFLIFMGLPAGKKLFVITSLLFSIILVSYRAIQRRFAEYKEKKSAENSEEKIVVETK